MKKSGEQLKARIVDIGDQQVLGECEDGRKIWLEGPAVPGDEVLARVLKTKSTFLSGTVEEISLPAPSRIPPECPVFDACPGCSLQALPYEEECSLKERKIRSALKRIGGLDEYEWAGFSPARTQIGYRNKLDLSVAGHQLGYQTKGGLLAIDDCPLGAPILRESVRMFQQLLREAFPEDHRIQRALFRTNNEQAACLLLLEGSCSRNQQAELRAFCQNAGSVSGLFLRRNRKAPWIKVFGEAWQIHSLAGFRHRIAYDSFFQVNHEQAERLVAQAMEWVQTDRPQTAVDLFCGTGAFTLPLSSLASGEVWGVDADVGDPPPKRGIRFERANLNKGLPDSLRGLKTPVDLVLLDPPRAGISDALTHDMLSTLRPRRILYVSCNPSTLARDCKRLTVEGRYQLNRVFGIDLFPRTSHVESLALLEHT